MSNSKISINVDGDVSTIGINNDAWTVETMKEFDDARYRNVDINVPKNVVPIDVIKSKILKVASIRNTVHYELFEKILKYKSEWHDGLIFDVMDPNYIFIITCGEPYTDVFYRLNQGSVGDTGEVRFRGIDRILKDSDGYVYGNIVIPVNGDSPSLLQIGQYSTGQNANMNVYAIPIDLLML